MNNIKTVPNQKVITIKKEKCDKQNYYTMINLNALEKAGIDLQAGAFKLWVYFAKNQNNFTMALSSSDAEETFGIKIKQYNNAVKELIEKGYLIQDKGNYYIFYEVSRKNKADNTKSNNEDNTKCNNEFIPKDIRNNTDNTNNNTKQFVF